MVNKQILGVIGGAGVAATNKFNELLEVKLTKNGAFRDSHHPEIIIYQAIAVPSRSMYLESRGESFIPGYIDIGLKLKKIGATVLCMTCNTAHYAINEIKEGVGLPFINMVDETVKEVKKYNPLKVGLIMSDGSIKGKVYEKYLFSHFPNVKIIYPDDFFQKEVTRGIVNIKNKYRFSNKKDKNRPNFIFTSVCKYLEDNGADVIILGCTDIGVDFSKHDFKSIKIIDSLEVLSNVFYESIERIKYER